MPKPAPAHQDGFTTTAEEIRASESLFVDEAVRLFRERMLMEYPRLRGYAIEAGTGCISLAVTASFNFSTRQIDLVSMPQFQPMPGVARASVPFPQPHAD